MLTNKQDRLEPPAVTWLCRRLFVELAQQDKSLDADFFRPLLLMGSTAIRKDQKYFPWFCVSPQIARLICPS